MKAKTAKVAISMINQATMIFPYGAPHMRQHGSDGESTPPGASEPSHFKIVEGLGIFALMRAEMHTLLARSPLPLTGVISDFVALLSVQPAAPPSGAYFIYFSATDRKSTRLNSSH